MCYNDRIELEKLEGQPLSEMTLCTTLKGMIPPDLVMDLERDSSLKKWDAAWEFCLEQAPRRREWNFKMGKGNLEADALEKKKPGDDDGG